MSQSSDPVAKLWESFIALLLLIVLVPIAMSVAVTAVTAVVAGVLHAIGQALGGLGQIVLFSLGILLSAGVVVRLGRSLQAYWQGVLDQFHGPKVESGRRSRGAEHLGPARRRRRRRFGGDPPLPLDGPE